MESYLIREQTHQLLGTSMQHCGKDFIRLYTPCTHYLFSKVRGPVGQGPTRPWSMFQPKQSHLYGGSWRHTP